MQSVGHFPSRPLRECVCMCVLSFLLGYPLSFFGVVACPYSPCDYRIPGIISSFSPILLVAITQCLSFYPRTLHCDEFGRGCSPVCSGLVSSSSSRPGLRIESVCMLMCILIKCAYFSLREVGKYPNSPSFILYQSLEGLQLLVEQFPNSFKSCRHGFRFFFFTNFTLCFVLLCVQYPILK